MIMMHRSEDINILKQVKLTTYFINAAGLSTPLGADTLICEGFLLVCKPFF